MFSRFNSIYTYGPTAYCPFVTAVIGLGAIGAAWHFSQTGNSKAEELWSDTIAVKASAKSGEAGQKSLANPWQPISLSIETAFEVVPFGSDTDFLVLGSEKLRRLRGDSGAIVWSTSRSTDSNKSKVRPFWKSTVLVPSWDFDDDDVEDVLLYSEYLNVEVFSGKTGRQLWTWKPTTKVVPIPTLVDKIRKNQRPAISLERNEKGGTSKLVIQYLADNLPNRLPQWRAVHIASASGEVLQDQVLSKPPSEAAGRRIHICRGPGPHADRLWTLPSKNEGVTNRFQRNFGHDVSYNDEAYRRALTTATDEGRFELSKRIYTADFNADGALDLFWLEEQRKRKQYLIHRMPSPRSQAVNSAENTGVNSRLD